jgi:hypothetical protein
MTVVSFPERSGLEVKMYVRKDAVKNFQKFVTSARCTGGTSKTKRNEIINPGR